MTVAPQEVLSEIRTLEPFPHVATRVLSVSAREDTVPSDITEVIQSDPALTAKVLRLCNSAYYGFQREVASRRFHARTNASISSSSGCWGQLIASSGICTQG